MKKISTLIFFALIGNSFSQTSPQTYTTPGSFTFTVPVSVTSITVEIVGGGGSGGGNGTGGGGGGGYAKGVYSVAPGATLAVKVGSGGAGSAAGTTSVGGFISATGGANGVSVSNPSVGGGGLGGVGSGGTIANRNGGAGGGGYYTYFGGGGGGAGGPISNGFAGGNTPVYNGTNCLTPGGSGSPSGGPPGGSGGKGAGFTNSTCSTTDPAANGGTFGGGGGGGNGIGSPFGIGAGGYCQISWAGCSTPAAPTNSTPASQTICANNSATLVAFGTGTLNWYNSPTSTVVLATGFMFTTTPTLTPGTYLYYTAATNTCGEGPRTSNTVVVNANPTVSAVSNTSLICVGQTASLTASGANTYSWNTTATTSVIAVSPTVTTSYSVTGTSNGCVGNTSITQSVSAGTGVNSFAAAETSALKIYPNPSKGDLMIAGDQEMNLSLVNNLGEVVKIISLNAQNNYKAPLTNLANGIYFIVGDNDHKTISQKIIVVK